MRQKKGVPQLEEAKKRIAYTVKKKLYELDLSGLNLIEVPAGVAKLTWLNQLYLNDNQLSELPEEIGKIKDLLYLKLGNNKLEKLPRGIGQLKSLLWLELYDNFLKVLPKEIESLTKLDMLDLSNNNLTELPPQMRGLTGMERLVLGRNKLTTLPKEIADLIKLRNLDVSNNLLKELPTSIAKLRLLVELDLRGNSTLISLPQTVIKQGTESIQNYLKALDEKTYVWTSKMVIVGEGGVGKTCLLDALQNKSFAPGRETTHGIDIRKLSLPHPKLKGITMDLNVWDFGGQVIYHATHQFYLTNHSLFILVWNTRPGYEVCKIYKWLETIQALAPDSPILIVATHSNDRGADLPKGDIERKYPEKVYFYEVDNINKIGIPEFKKAIQDIAPHLKYMGVERPKCWVDAALAIKRLRRKCIPKKEMCKIFTRNGVGSESHETLAIYLHELGDILYYPDDEELKETIIVKPAWVSKHIARILDSQEVSDQSGFLPKALMQELWHDLEPHLQDKFITLMERFDLSYKTEDKEEISLIVEKLKYEEHTAYKGEWSSFKSEREIVFKYELETIPAGIPTWFIARTHRFSKYIHWRYGVLLEDKDSKHLGLVIARPDDKEVWLKVKGIMPYYFFALLRDTLELTFNRFEGLKRITKVPCPGHNGKPCPNLFELADLETRMKWKGPTYTIECSKAPDAASKNVDIMTMLFGLSYAPEDLELVEQITGRVKQTIDEQTKTLVSEMQTKNEELIKFIQLEFIKSYQMQQKIMDQTCPNIFTLEPIEEKFFTQLLTQPLEKEEYILQLYCQKPGCIHPVEKGKYKVVLSKGWIITMKPYYEKILKILRWASLLLPPAVDMILERFKGSDMESEEELYNKYVRDLLEQRKSNERIDEHDDLGVYLFKAGEEELNLIRRVLIKVDPSRYWGGLVRKVTPEGHILWLCKEHAKEYK